MLAKLKARGGYEQVLSVFKPKPHCLLAVPSREALLKLASMPDGEQRIVDVFAKRERAIELEKVDPFRYGVELEPWRDAQRLLESTMLLAVFGGNRSSKTEFGAWLGVRKLTGKDGAQVLWLHESEPTSIDVQQVAVHKYIPPEWRGLKKGAVTNVAYSRKNGFSDNKFVLPNGSVGKFGSYQQDIQNYEGLEYDLIVADENMPLAWLRTLLVRLATRAGKFVWSYTPIHGITPAGKEVVEGAVTIESRPVDPQLLDPGAVHVEDCPRGHMPYIQRSAYGDCMIIYFHSVMNPYGGYETLCKILSGMEREDRKRRGYGYARNTLLTLFPQFSALHVIKRDQVPQDVTRYLIADPAGARNMFMVWVAVDSRGYHYVYREWPDVPGFGEWAVPSEDSRHWDGLPGPAQPTLGYGVLEYKRLILKLEDKEIIEERYMDPRSGAAQAVTEDKGGSSLMDRFREEQRDNKNELAGPSMDFLPAPGLREDEGIRVIQDMLSYDRAREVTAYVNEPRLFIVEQCQNVIWALKNYTGHDGEKAACKDPIDDLRYMATADLQYLPPGRMRSWGGGSY